MSRTQTHIVQSYDATTSNEMQLNPHFVLFLYCLPCMFSESKNREVSYMLYVTFGCTL